MRTRTILAAAFGLVAIGGFIAGNIWLGVTWCVFAVLAGFSAWRARANAGIVRPHVSLLIAAVASGLLAVALIAKSIVDGNRADFGVAVLVLPIFFFLSWGSWKAWAVAERDRNSTTQ